MPVQLNSCPEIRVYDSAPIRCRTPSRASETLVRTPFSTRCLRNCSFVPPSRWRPCQGRNDRHRQCEPALRALLSGSCASASNCPSDYFLCVCKAAVVPTLSGSPQWECLRVRKREQQAKRKADG